MIVALTLYEWLSLAQWVVMAGVSILLWRMRTSVKDAVDQADHARRIKSVELEIERLRHWRHDSIVPWQQTLMDKLDEHFLTRREWDQARNNNRGGDDSPVPPNRRRLPRP